MIDEGFRIYVEQLRDGKVEKIQETFTAKFLDVSEKDLSFSDPVEVKGEAYLADDTLLMHLDVTTFFVAPCRICNESVKEKIVLKGLYLMVPLDEIKGSVYDFQELLRESILLEIPNLVECQDGKCPQREEIKHFLREEQETSDEEASEERYHPFADLDIVIEQAKKKNN